MLNVGYFCIMSKFIIHPADKRGYANHGWLKANHSFSFASFYDPEKINFGALRVLNDDEIAAGMGFATHPHDNMEIITIPLEGDLRHQDSMGNSEVLNVGSIQVMSAGKGLYHSEHNANRDKELKLLQIWIIPNKSQVEPKYGDFKLPELVKNEWMEIVSPTKSESKPWIHQDAWLSLGEFEKNTTKEYNFNKTENGLYIFIIEGELVIEGQLLKRRDAIGIWDSNKINIHANENSKVLLLEVPMQFN